MSDAPILDPNSILNLEERMKGLELESQAISLRVAGNHTYEFGGDYYNGPQDVISHLGSSIDEVTVGMFLEVFGAFSRLDDSTTDSKAYADKQKSAHYLDATTLEIDAMYTMGLDTAPSLFAKKKGTRIPVDANDGFGEELSTYGKYTGASNGRAVREEMLRKITQLITTITGAINGFGKGASLARHTLEQTLNQVNRLFTFWNEWHMELLHQCNYTTGAAWTFIGVCSRAVMHYDGPP